MSKELKVVIDNNDINGRKIFVDKLTDRVVQDLPVAVFSSSQILGKEDYTLSFEGNCNTENEETVKILCMDNVTTEPEEESKKEPEIKSEDEEMTNFVHLILKEIIKGMKM